MKLLVLAQIPTPLHGQSLMVQTLVRGLPTLGIPVHHVNLRLSHDTADIGRWRAGKVFAVLDACYQTVVARFTRECDALYYVPAPAKRGALYRDWVVMLLCRPFFRHLVLHFHNGGLAHWLTDRATPIERWVTCWLLGRADLAIVLTNSLRADAAALSPKKIAVVPNGINAPEASPAATETRLLVLFLGAVSYEKGAADLLAAVQQLRARGVAATAIFAGPVAPDLDEKFTAAREADPGVCEVPGFVDGSAKADLLTRCTCVCLPTYYPHEGQPLVALEALAADKPLVISKWRGLPETVPPWVPVVSPRDVSSLADALADIHAHPPPTGAQRSFFLAHFTVDHHLQTLAAALTTVTIASKAAHGAPDASK